MSWGIAFRLRQQLKGSPYDLPVLGALLGPVLGQLTLWLDRSVQLPEAWSYSAATATAVLSVLVGAMVALLGFVVTIGVLVVQMATGTLSPRYMRLWYRDLLQKVVLATLAGTLTFSFSLLRHVEEISSGRSTGAGCWPWPASTTASSSYCTRSATSCPPAPAWSRSSGGRRPPPSAGCGA